MPVYKYEGGYYVKYRVKDSVTGKYKQITKRGFETQREAKKWEAENKYSDSASNVTFWDVFQKYLANNDTSKDTRKKKESWIKMYFKELKDVPIDRITTYDLVEWRNRLKEQPISPQTCNNGLQYVRGVFGFYSTVYGANNVGSILKPFRVTQKDKPEMQVWTPEEFDTFVSYVKSPTLQALFKFIFWTGCRRGEALALTKDCFTGNSVRIYRSIKHAANGFMPLKTESSVRTITLDSALMKELQPLIEKADPFVFGGEHPININYLQRTYTIALKRSNVKRIRLHDFRHSHASILLNNGVNIVAVSKRLGHATVAQTLETYAHLMPDSDENLVKSIEKIKKSHTKSHK